MYRLAVTKADAPDFELQMVDDRVNLPGNGVTVVRVHADRHGYNGPIHLSATGLPASVKLRNALIPGGATDALLTLEAPPESLAAKIVEIVGSAEAGKANLSHKALRADSVVTREQPWLRSDLACAITAPTDFRLDWDGGDPQLAIGTDTAGIKAAQAPE